MSDWRGVRILTPPEADPVSVADVKARLRIDASDEDALLAQLVRGSVARIDGPQGIGVAMMRQTWRKAMDDFPKMIRLPGAPFVDVVELRYLDVAGVWQVLDPALYRVDGESEPARVEPVSGGSWPATAAIDTGTVQVDYRVGAATAGEVPGDLIDALCLMVGHRYEHREAVMVEMSASPLPLGVADILADHRRVAVA